MSDLAGTDDWRCQSRLVQQPGVGDPGIALPALGGKLAEAAHHGEVLFPIVKLSSILVGPGTRRVAGRDIVRRAVAGQKASGQRAPGDQRDAQIPAKWNHLAFFFPIDQVVMVLHRYEPSPPVRLGNVLRFGKLPGPHAGRPDITHFS